MPVTKIQPKGLTLVELVVAMAIMGLIASATLGVVSRLAKASSAQAANPHDASVFEASLRSLLESDVTHASWYRLKDSGLDLQTRSGLESGTLELNHEQRLVRYEIRQVNSTGWLTRREQRSDGKTFVEVVCPAATAILLRSSGDDKSPPPATWTPLPSAAEVLLGFQDNRPDMDYVFYRK
jgi:prepilin-type N-terminal cleavage/methylation domain-containing protein